mgnify:FL=1|tara:strand:- start:2104 stop:3795 length:1692 start_codon:yes stop_codon:yes gene_type:complete
MDNFFLPIQLLKNNKDIDDNFYNDLELLENNNNNGVYNKLFKPNNKYSIHTLKILTKKYTSDPQFIKDTQTFIKNNKTNKNNIKTINKTIEVWNSIKNDDQFLDKFSFISWEPVQFLNEFAPLLSIITFYSIFSPVINLISPLVILIIPFILLKIMGHDINVTNYVNILYEQLKKFSFFKFFTESNATYQAKAYYLFCFGMYIYNIYQNILSCIDFYKNTKAINKNFKTFDTYCDYTIDKLNITINNCKKLKSYQPFKKQLKELKFKLSNFKKSLNDTPRFSINPLNLIRSGMTLKQYYLLYSLTDINQLLQDTFVFHGFLDNIYNFSTLVKNKKVLKCAISNKSNTYVEFNNFYHPSIENNCVQNSIKIDKNIIITGPNASGKTTLIKATLLNLLLVQQTGYGFFESGKIKPFDNLYCYLNIPDTNSRDSLFQAEARRCINILNKINKTKKQTHFCIFDELFSGTNPYEAISSAYSYLNYISKNNNVKFLLTTHFNKLCEMLNKNESFINMKMDCELKNDIPNYKYKINQGISYIKGGVCVLKQLEFPDKIITETKKIIKKL